MKHKSTVSLLAALFLAAMSVFLYTCEKEESEPSVSVADISSLEKKDQGSEKWLEDFWKEEVPSAVSSKEKKEHALLEETPSSEKESCGSDEEKESDPVLNTRPWDKNNRYTVSDLQDGHQLFQCKIISGDHAGALLRQWLSNEEAEEVIQKSKKTYALSEIRAGHTFSVKRNSENKVTSIFYDIDDESRLVVKREGEDFKARVEKFEYEISLEHVKGTIESSLFESVEKAGGKSILALKLGIVFEHQINFVNDIHPGDIFELIVEKKYLGGTFRKYGTIVAARFTTGGKTYEAYRFKDSKGHMSYFDEKGRSLKTAFLKAPLNFTRVSSSYSLRRMHPVFHKVRPHLGVDYAAPTGTPVRALGSGVVSFKGWKGGYGNTLIIRHPNGVETQYAHLSRFARNIGKGVRVDQGRVVAYVGSTGISTGPHLDFRVKKNGKFVNPNTLSGARSHPVTKSEMPKFQRIMEESRAYMDGKRALSEYGKNG